MRNRRIAGLLTALSVVGISGAGCGSEPGASSEAVEPQSAALGSANLVVSQLYGGGGNSGATYTHDFIEIFNRGPTSVTVSGLSVQYASATGSSWQGTTLSGTIPAGGYYLVQEAAGTGGTTALPTPDATGTISMSATSGKVALVDGTTALTCSTSCVPSTSILDLVGYGSSATGFEGSGPTSTLSNTTAALRAGAGCMDTDNNASDFSASAVSPRNSATTDHACGAGGGDASADTGAGADTGTRADSGGGLPALPSPTLTPVTMPNLVFGAFGDIRPNNPNDTAGYPDAVLSSIFSGLTALGVSFAVDAGDHCFQSSTSSGSFCHTQFVSHFMADKAAHYAGALLPTMGNHEGCGTDAATTGNCTSWTSGLVHDYLVDIVQPTTGQSAFPYYSLLASGAWGTAKFVVVAANAWTSAQSTWLTSTLTVPTTYTFVLRHEPSNDPRAPGVTPSESLFASHFGAGTLTLSITGHTHLVQLPGGTLPYGDTFGATQAYETILGNAGAPLDAGPYYGFALFTRRASDGAMVAQAYETMSSDGVTPIHNTPDPKFRFAVNPNGSSNASTSLP